MLVFALALGCCVFRASCAAPALPVPKLSLSSADEVCDPVKLVGSPPTSEGATDPPKLGTLGTIGVWSSDSWSLSPGETRRLRSSKFEGSSELCARRRRRIILRCEMGREDVGREDAGRPSVGSSGRPGSTPFPPSCPSDELLLVFPEELVVPSPSVLFPPVARWVRAPAHQLQSGQ